MSAGAGLSIVGSGPSTSVAGEMPGSFVPTVTAITTSQDLQWMVQPTLISSQASGQTGTGTSTMTELVSLVDPYDLPGPSYSGPGFTPPSSDTQGPAPGPIRQSRTRSRRTRDESVSEDGDVGVLVSVCASTVCLASLCTFTHRASFTSDTAFSPTATKYDNISQCKRVVFYAECVSLFCPVPAHSGGGGEEACSARAKQAGCCEMQKPPTRADGQTAVGERRRVLISDQSE